MSNRQRKSRHSNTFSAQEHEKSSTPGDSALGRALALVRFLRERCPWDARQDAGSLRPYLLEEAHEVAEAIIARDDNALRDELGDLLLNLAFQVVLAEERDAFGAADVVAELEAKMRLRHPHVYGDAETPPEWEEVKARGSSADQDAGEGDVFDGIPPRLEPLERALRAQDLAAARNFDWPDITGALEKLREEVGELEALPLTGGEVDQDAIVEEIGDLLFSAVNVARLAGVHPSGALREATAKFERRFRDLLSLARIEGLEPRSSSLAELDRLWDRVKNDEK